MRLSGCNRAGGQLDRKARPLAFGALDIDGAVGASSRKVDWSNIYAPPPRVAQTEMISGDSAEAIAAALADKLMAEKVI